MAKMISLKQPGLGNADTITLAQLGQIWNDETITYTDCELHRIRDWMSMLTGIIVKTATRQPAGTTTKIIALNHVSNETAKSHSLRAGEYRRAS